MKPTIPWPLITSIANNETKPIMAKRPFIFSAYTVQPACGPSVVYILGSKAKTFSLPSLSVKVLDFMALCWGYMNLADVYQCNENFTKSQVNTHNFLTKAQNTLKMFTKNRL
jgi:hypothetical protein